MHIRVMDVGERETRMHIRRTIIIPAIMALSAAGSILAGSAMALAPAVAPAAAVASASHARPDVLFDG